MKIIEAMKKIKDLQQKAEDLRAKISVHCADMTHETPVYADQKGQVAEWLQAHGDLLKEILRLRVAIQRTNIQVQVPIEIGGKVVTKCIAEWIHRRRDLAGLELQAWQKLTDRGLKEGYFKTTAGQDVMTTIRRHYDPKLRDEKAALYKSEPLVIDSSLEVVNAVTDLVE